MQPECVEGRVVCGTVYMGICTIKIWDQSQEYGIVFLFGHFIQCCMVYDAENALLLY